MNSSFGDALSFEVSIQQGQTLRRGVWGRGRARVPLYVDHHKNVEGLTTEAVAGAHKQDLEV